MENKLLTGNTEMGNDTSVETNLEINLKEEEKEKNFNSFLSRIKRYSLYGLSLIASAGTLGHLSNEEYPDFIENSPFESKQVPNWDSQTYKELKKLSEEYAIFIESTKQEHPITKEEAEKKFMDFVSQYGSNIRIISPAEDIGFTGRIHTMLLQQDARRAHYEINNTIVYEPKQLTKDKEGAWDFSTSGIREFISEFSHHINGDANVSRMITYAEDLAAKKFDQQEMYEDIYTSEYQAHSITQNAVAEYLSPTNTHTFPEIYNTYQEYYRAFTEESNCEDNNNKTNLLYKYIFAKKVDDVIKNKETAIENLKNLRDLLNGLKRDNKEKINLFATILKIYPLDIKADYISLTKDIDMETVDPAYFTFPKFSQ